MDRIQTESYRSPQGASVMNEVGVATLVRIWLWTMAGMAVIAALAAWLGEGAAAVPADIAVRFIPGARSSLLPEPGERLAYIVACLAAPLLIGAGWWFEKRLSGRLNRFDRPLIAGFCLAAAGGVLAAYRGSSFAQAFCAWEEVRFAPLVVVLVWLALAFWRPGWRWRGGEALWFLAIVFALALAISYRVFSCHSVGSPETGWLDIHLSAVIYAQAQVCQGLKLLREVPAQYGLYVLYLKPVFLCSGFSILHFSTVMTVLQLLCLLWLTLFLHRFVANPLLRVLGLLGLVYLMGGWFQLQVAWDPYFQYFPLRLVMPVLVLLLVCTYARHPESRLRQAVPPLAAGLGMWWNLDSGVVTLLATVGVLGLIAVLRHWHEPRRAVGDSALVAAWAVLGVAAAYGLLSLSNGQFLPLGNLFAYQADFYGAGFYMLPLPLSPHPWLLVAGLYVLAMILGTWCCLPPRGDFERGTILLFLGILGAGLFSYYQGRSHDYCLPAVAWPAWLLALLLTEWTLAAVRRARLPRLALLPAGLVVAAGLCWTLALVGSSDRLWVIARRSYRDWREHRSTSIAASSHWLRVQAAQGGPTELLILSQRQGEYYAEAGLRSPWHGPSLVEMLRQADADRLYAELPRLAANGQLLVDMSATTSYLAGFWGQERVAKLAYLLPPPVRLPHAPGIVRFGPTAPAPPQRNE